MDFLFPIETVLDEFVPIFTLSSVQASVDIVNSFKYTISSSLSNVNSEMASIADFIFTDFSDQVVVPYSAEKTEVQKTLPIASIIDLDTVHSLEQMVDLETDIGSVKSEPAIDTCYQIQTDVTVVYYYQ